MAEPGLIEQQLAALRAQLPAGIVEELADGLAETYASYRAAGLEPQAAARAAICEFGDAPTITASFADQAPARRAARALLGAGPVVGECWAGVLLYARAWHWATPAVVPLVFGALLAAVIALLLTAALSGGYRRARRAAGAALAGLVLLDLALPSALVLPGLARGWPVLLATGASLLRAAYAAHAWRRLHAR